MAKYFKISNKVNLPLNTVPIKDKSFIPSDIGFEDNKTVMEQVGICINYNIPVLLVGETGTGKTSIVRHLAAKTNNAFVRVNHNGGTSVEDIVGRWVITEHGTEWQDGILIKAMKEGYYYLADELNAASAEINFAYHSLLDDDKRVILVEKGHEVVMPHPNFRFFGAMNPPAEYAGAKELNKALNSRFAVVKVDFVPPKIEAKIVSSRTGVSLDVAEQMVKFAVDVRAGHAKETTRFVMSTRELIMWGHMYNVYGSFTKAAEIAVLNKVSPDDETAINDLMNLHFKETDVKSFKTGKKSAPSRAGTPIAEAVIGDAVEVIKPYQKAYVGLQGIVRAINSPYPTSIGVEIPGFAGHDLDGSISSANGYWIEPDCLKII